jgi:vacuolar-type H+-ATPase subunit F/Vma7
MPAHCAFIGDEVSATGFRLAGVSGHCPAPHEAAALFQRLRGEAALILLTQEALGWVGERPVRAAILVGRPLVLVIPDVRGQSSPPDLGEAIRRQLGMATSRDGLASREAGAGSDETSRDGLASREALPMEGRASRKALPREGRASREAGAESDEGAGSDEAAGSDPA